jgi:hypothetical protein
VKNETVDIIIIHREMIADNNTPDAQEAENSYRVCAMKFTRILQLAIAFITESESQAVAAWAVAYATGNPQCAGVSITDRASMLKISPQALSKQIRAFIAQADLDDSTGYLYSKK